MKVYADPLLAETVPDGTFGGARPHSKGRQQHREPDPEGPRRFAELAAAVAEIDHDHGYGVHLRYRSTDTTSERNAA
ncbi:hypothetical protein [Streptomyces violarus]|uniref:hypothetical protein n=1 Tax=Streptomyces violarus TaxID=67380 RepID=UPI0021C1A879|nr:hypothetical protein [Streptomyces violarus]MCT9145370.1 hypothetical protein [Streptomyces violarus]